MAGASFPSRRSVLGTAALGVTGVWTMAGTASGEAAAAAGSRGRIRQSVARWCYGSMSLEDLCRHLARIGYRGIDLLKPEEWPTARKHGLISTMGNGTGSSIGEGWNRRERHPELVDLMHRYLDLAAEVGVPNVICFPGERRGQDDEEGIRNCVEGLKQVVGRAEERKVNICMEYLNSKVDHKDYQFDHMAYGVAVARQIGSPRFGILYDIYHAQIMEGDVIRTLRDNKDYILHYHTGGNPGRNEIDETQELYYPAIMRAIAETGFTGFVAQEFIPKGDPVKGLEQAFAICDV